MSPTKGRVMTDEESAIAVTLEAIDETERLTMLLLSTLPTEATGEIRECFAWFRKWMTEPEGTEIEPLIIITPTMRNFEIAIFLFTGDRTLLKWAMPPPPAELVPEVTYETVRVGKMLVFMRDFLLDHSAKLKRVHA